MPWARATRLRPPAAGLVAAGLPHLLLLHRRLRWQHCARQRRPHEPRERFNATLRARLGQHVRKTLSFAKSDLMLDICIRLFLHQYNGLS